MSDERCAHCGAAMMADAPWCTLCLTPRPAPEPVVAAPPVAAVVATNTSLYAPVSRQKPVAAGTAGEMAGGQSGALREVEVTWPCQACGQAVSLAADLCPQCGAGFLGGAEAMPTLNLPVIGDVTKRSKPVMYAIAAAVGTSIALLVISALALLGSIF